MALAAGLVLLAATLLAAVCRPRGLPEAVVAVPAAGACVALGLIGAGAAADEARELAGVVAFLAAVLVLAHLCAAEGLFRYAGTVMGRAARGRPISLLGWVFAVGALVTTALSLDATVVLFTPVVVATVAATGLRERPYVFATVHLANSASLLLPVSNLTNLLAFEASGLSFARFALLMTLPALAVLAVEYAIVRRFFAADLARAPVLPPRADVVAVPVPAFALAVVGATLVGLAFSAALGVPPAAVAAAGALALAARSLTRRQHRDGSAATRPAAAVRDMARAADPLFAAFVLGLGVTVRAVEENGLGEAIGPLVSGRSGLLGLLAIAAVAALLANAVNNLPAILLLLPSLAEGGPGPVLAALIGVNIGPNLTYVGSLATLLWLRVLRRSQEAKPAFGDFLRLGLLTVPASVVAAVLALWLALRLGW